MELMCRITLTNSITMPLIIITKDLISITTHQCTGHQVTTLSLEESMDLDTTTDRLYAFDDIIKKRYNCSILFKSNYYLIVSIQM